MLCSDNQSEAFEQFIRYARLQCGLNSSSDLSRFQLSHCVSTATDSSAGDDVTGDDDDGGAIYRHIEAVIYSRVIVTICIVGVLGNVLNLIVLSCILLRKAMDRMERSVTVSLLALALSDILFCVAVAPFLVNDFEHVLHDRPGFLLAYSVYQGAVISTLITSSTFLTVLMAVSRYLAICHPLHARYIVGMRFAVLSIAGVFVFSVVLNLPRFWHQSIACVRPNEFVTVYLAVSGYLQQHDYLEQVYYVSYLCVAVLAPLGVLGYCNYYLIRALRHSVRMRREFARQYPPSSSSSSSSAGDRQRRTGNENSTHVITLTLVTIVVLYAVLVSPAEISNVFTYLVRSEHAVSPAYDVAVALANALQTVNFSFNFVLYCVINVCFRRVVRDLVTCRACCHDDDRKRKSLDSVETTSSSGQTKLVVVWSQRDRRRSVTGSGFTSTSAVQMKKLSVTSRANSARL